MGKEIIICTIILMLIFLGNSITQKYTVESVEKINNDLYNLRDELKKIEESEKNYDNNKNNNINNIEISSRLNDKVKTVYENWDNKHNNLAYYIEHDELEKVETNIIAMKSFVESGEYKESISEIDKNIFLLEHIKDKYAFNLQNIF